MLVESVELEQLRGRDVDAAAGDAAAGGGEGKVEGGHAVQRGGGEGATREWEVGVDLKGRGWDGLIGGKGSDGNGMRRGGPAEGRNSSNVPLLQAAHTQLESIRHQ